MIIIYTYGTYTHNKHPSRGNELTAAARHIYIYGCAYTYIAYKFTSASRRRIIIIIIIIIPRICNHRVVVGIYVCVCVSKARRGVRVRAVRSRRTRRRIRSISLVCAFVFFFVYHHALAAADRVQRSKTVKKKSRVQDVVGRGPARARTCGARAEITRRAVAQSVYNNTFYVVQPSASIKTSLLGERTVVVVVQHLHRRTGSFDRVFPPCDIHDIVINPLGRYPCFIIISNVLIYIIQVPQVTTTALS